MRIFLQTSTILSKQSIELFKTNEVINIILNIRMITIIAGTNRKDSNTKKIAEAYKKILLQKGVKCKILLLDEIEVHERNEAFIEMENKYLLEAEKLIIAMPEYNGSFPGILKLMIDNTDVKNVWPNKKILLAGVSTGRAGNLRGMDHLTGVLLYLKANVHYNRLPISIVHTLLNDDGILTDEATINTLNTQVDEFLLF